MSLEAIVAVLIVFACLSLGVSLYCLLFMVPVKRFLERIRSLGGGMKGIESHVDSVREEIHNRLNELESTTRGQVEQARQTVQEALERVAQESRDARRELDKVRRDLQSLQAELRGTAADSMKVAQGTGSLVKQLDQLRTDFDVLDVELRESVRQQVANSFSTVESTVLSALEAIEGEIIYGTAKPAEAPKGFTPEPDRPRTGPQLTRTTARRAPENIITVQPLFGEPRPDGGQRPKTDAGPDGGDGKQAEEKPDGEGA